MAQFEVYDVPSDIADCLKSELVKQVERYALPIEGCRLVGAQHNTLIEVRMTTSRGPEVRFLVPMEDIALGDFARLIEDAFEMNGYRVPAGAGRLS
jgi:hypothetical protein